MILSTALVFVFRCVFLVCVPLQLLLAGHCLCAMLDNITAGSSVTDGLNETIVSPGMIFEMGFFTPVGNPNMDRYVGIWYQMDPKTVVWVANRDKPLRNTTGILTVTTSIGELVVKDDKGTTYFSSGVIFPSNMLMLKLMDTGNAVLVDRRGRMLWQSFHRPTDTFLPGMYMDDGLNLISWKSQDDPATGNFTFTRDLEMGGENYTISKSEKPYWKSGGGLQTYFNPNKMFEAAANMLTNNSEPRIMLDGNYLRLMMNSTGKIQFYSWEINKKGWNLTWSEPKDPCSIYNTCGVFSYCSMDIDSKDSKRCDCLPRFERSNVDSTNRSECKRSIDIDCSSDSKSSFLEVPITKIKTPVSLISGVGSKDACQGRCLRDCGCQAYWFNPGNDEKAGRPDYSNKGCWLWTSELEDIEVEWSAGTRPKVAVRVFNLTAAVNQTGPNNILNQPEGINKKSRSLKPVQVFAIVAVVALLSCSVFYITRRMTANRKQERRRNAVLRQYDIELRVKDLLDIDYLKEDDRQGIAVPSFELETILVATDGFSDEKKLGQGGFGPVYKGMMAGGWEVAVKRLSSHSGQGLEEFKNEVTLIAKLQHRNLVRLLGYCIEGNERVLLYEYLPNKSLDLFLFDPKLAMLLDWKKRFDIILGIARGLLYLHQDSRLRIIHRDLKTSNILLDDDMNPKISDFGLARIFKGRETAASTNRIMGTYGYMSPEYALDGLFSVKSDVFSFGVVVLEIVSGKKNTGFYQSRHAINLLGYAWKMWTEERILDLMDQSLLDLHNSSEVLRCIQIAFLCVQEDPGDRPTMSDVVKMLSSDTASFPRPKQPAFVARKALPSMTSSSSSKALASNEMTISIEEGR